MNGDNQNYDCDDCGGDLTRTDCDYVNEGMLNWLNNKPKQAEQFLKGKIERTPVLAAYSFVLCMNGIISSELDKIREAQETLKTLEKRCIASAAYRNTNGFYDIWRKTFAKRSTSYTKPLTIQSIEEQIILADVYLLTAALSFLTEDMTGLLKGSWLLRKAWKIYNKNYCQIYELYMKHCCKDEANHLLPPTPSAQFYLTSSKSVCDMKNSASSNSFVQNGAIRKNSFTKRTTFKLAQCTENMVPKTFNQPQHFDKNLNPSSDNILVSSNLHPSKLNLHLDLQTNYLNEATLNGPLTCPSMPSYSFQTATPTTTAMTPTSSKIIDHELLLSIEPHEIARLMGAVSFGYGIFQLCSSLLPAKILKIFNFLGFTGVQSTGVACLMFARTTSDVRGIMATLVLLWFYTFGTQIFPNEDGYAKEKVNAATRLLDESIQQYPNAGLYLFFRGRLERMKANISEAIEYFENSCKHSAQIELKILCLHEMAWCNLICLEFSTCADQFDNLRKCSTFSKAFYSYMACVCHGACGNYNEFFFYRDEINSTIVKTKLKDTDITKFLQNRIDKIPEDDDAQQNNKFYWRYLAYELLYLWSALSSLKDSDLEIILSECLKMRDCEPMLGLSHFLVGAIASSLNRNAEAIDAFQKCISIRTNANDKCNHISVLANVELAMILLQMDNKRNLEEAKKLLATADSYGNYDLENRFSAQIQRELKKL